MSIFGGQKMLYGRNRIHPHSYTAIGLAPCLRISVSEAEAPQVRPTTTDGDRSPMGIGQPFVRTVLTSAPRGMVTGRERRINQSTKVVDKRIILNDMFQTSLATTLVELSTHNLEQVVRRGPPW